MEKWLTFAALGLALFAAFRKPAPVIVDGGGNNSLPSITLGDGPVFNIQGTQRTEPYQGGAYPPFNSCGCGRASTGVRFTTSLAPVYGAASQTLQGVPVTPAAKQKILSPRAAWLVPNGAFV